MNVTRQANQESGALRVHFRDVVIKRFGPFFYHAVEVGERHAWSIGVYVLPGVALSVQFAVEDE